MAPRRYRVIWTEQGSRTLDEALEHVAHQSLPAARRLLTECLTAADSLEELPERGHQVPETDRHPVREIFVQRYRLLYDVHASTVRILALIHGARDFTAWRRRQADSLNEQGHR